MNPRTSERPNHRTDALPRCSWCAGDPRLIAYHDREWGVPVRTDAQHFERLTLEIFQAGLSWRTILHKRAAFRRAFAGFLPARVARFGPADVRRLLADPGIVRNRAKIAATIANARAALVLRRSHGSLARYLATLPLNHRAAGAKALRARFRFVGPTIAKSYLQSVGLWPAPHQPGCWLASSGPRLPGVRR